nr:hypothetical protein [Aneurinibacillus terranovensis]
MISPYFCPSCRNRTRFTVIEQVPHYIKIDPGSGEIMEKYAEDLELFQVRYTGSPQRIQCGACGMIDDDKIFMKMAQNFNQKGSM